MTSILNYIWRLWFLLLATVFTLLFFLPVMLLSIKKEHYKYAYHFVRIWSFALFYGTGFSYKFTHLTEKKIDPKQPYVIIANHTSIMDIMLCAILFPHHPICFVGKKELADIPIFGIIYKRICVLVDRASLKSRTAVYGQCAERMQEGNSVVIFPEGGVTEDPSDILGNFKIGAFVLASKHQFPIIVLSFVGLKMLFPFTWGKGHPGIVRVFLNEILVPDKNPEELKRISYEMMKKTLKST